MPIFTRCLMRDSTLQLTRFFGGVVWLTITLLPLFVGIAEAVTRSEFFQAPLTPPKMGSRHYQLGHKLALLDAEVKRNGPVDCIMVGSSMVDVGFNPDSFQTGYKETAGRAIRCFNFGIDASSAASTATLVKILMEDYHPRILVLGTDARDYTVSPEDRDPAVILNTPWVMYRSGAFSLDGWLTEHSHFYRYRQHLSRLMRFNLEGTLWSETNLNFEILANGQTPIEKVADYINTPPNPQDDSFEVVYYSRIFRPYQLLEENLDALEKMMEYNGTGTQVIVVEMPVSDGLYYFFGNGEADYSTFIVRVSELANLHQIPFWRTEPLDSIPDDGWSDYSHLNITGAEIFSAWLGGRVGEAETQGIIEPSSP
jgi:hypothetical protein